MSKTEYATSTVFYEFSNFTQPNNNTILIYESPVPLWGTILIAIAASIFFLIACFCCVFCFCRCKPSKRKFEKISMDNNLGNYEIRSYQPIADLPHKEYGVLFYSLDYNLAKSLLTVGVKNISGLPGSIFSKPLNPFVKVRLFPNLHTEQSSVAHFSRNPSYNEVFTFNMPPKKQKETVLMFMVYDHQVFKRHVKLSQINMPLQNFALGELIEDFAALEAPVLSEEDTDTGEVCISLRYVPALSLLSVIVIEAKDLQTQDSSYKDPYVKVYLLINEKIVNKKKTKTRAVSDVNPYFNESFNFKVDSLKLQKTELLVRVAFRKRLAILSKNIGEALISSRKTGTGLKHWLEVTGKPGYPLAMWHSLLPCER